MTELVIMPSRNLESLLLRQSDEFLRIPRVQCERFLDVNMRSLQQTLLTDLKMTCRRSCNMNHIRPGLVKKPLHVSAVSFDTESFSQLSSHQFFPVANPNNFAPANPLDLRRVRVRNLAAPDNANFKHVFLPPCNFRDTASGPLRWKLVGTSPKGASTFHWCIGFPSSTRARHSD